jgi:hypothetical protein
LFPLLSNRGFDLKLIPDIKSLIVGLMKLARGEANINLGS